MAFSVKDSQWGDRRSCESYKHRFAKQILAEWFRSAASESSGKYAECCGLKWRINESVFPFGVYEEYPVASDVKHDRTIWMWDYSKWGRLPNFSDLVEDGQPPDMIFDVAILRRDRVTYAFEIVHKNGITPQKAERLLSFDVTTHIVSADWVLGQIECPKQIKSVAIFDRGNLITSKVA